MVTFVFGLVSDMNFQVLEMKVPSLSHSPHLTVRYIVRFVAARVSRTVYIHLCDCIKRYCRLL